MSSLTVNLDLPRDLLEALNASEGELEGRLKELIALELFREGRISSGNRAAWYLQDSVCSPVGTA